MSGYINKVFVYTNMYIHNSAIFIIQQDLSYTVKKCTLVSSFGVSVCTHNRQVEHQHCSRTGRTIFNEHPVFNGQKHCSIDEYDLLPDEVQATR